MWINKKKIMKKCEEMIRELERSEDFLSEYDKGYDVGYINGVHNIIREPFYDLRLMALEQPIGKTKTFMRKMIDVCRKMEIGK